MHVQLSQCLQLTVDLWWNTCAMRIWSPRGVAHKNLKRHDGAKCSSAVPSFLLIKFTRNQDQAITPGGDIQSLHATLKLVTTLVFLASIELIGVSIVTSNFTSCSRFQLVYACGTSMTLPGGIERAQAIQALTHIISGKAFNSDNTQGVLSITGVAVWTGINRWEKNHTSFSLKVSDKRKLASFYRPPCMFLPAYHMYVWHLTHTTWQNKSHLNKFTNKFHVNKFNNLETHTVHLHSVSC